MEAPYAFPRPVPPKHEKEEDDISLYRRVHIIGTSFKAMMVKGEGSASTSATISIQELSDLEKLANRLSKLYRIPEVDCLAALTECEPQLLLMTSGSISIRCPPGIPPNLVDRPKFLLDYAATLESLDRPKAEFTSTPNHPSLLRDAHPLAPSIMGSRHPIDPHRREGVITQFYVDES
jgi:hypothetical protein